MSNNDKHGAQCWDDLSPAELCLLIEKEPASIKYLKVTQNKLLKSLGKHQMVNKNETFAYLMTTKWELYSIEQCIQELDHTLQQAKQKDPQYLSKQLDSLKLQTSNTSFLVEAVDVLLKHTDKSIFEHYESTITNTITHVDKWFDTLTCLMNNIADHLECIELNQVVKAQQQQYSEPEKVKEGEESLFFNKRLLFSPSAQPTSSDSPLFSSKIPTGLPAYNSEHDGDPEPFLQQLENNLQIVNLRSNMWNMALAKYTQGSKTASNWARDLFTTHFSSTELQTCLYDKFFKLSHQPKEPVRKVIKRIDNIIQ
ncbi:hypothetical protein QOT17_014850 [Balamuthia mandrillaris]